MCSTDGEYPEFFRDSHPIARKQHYCHECGTIIPTGEKHRFVAGKWDGRFSAFRIHEACEELRDFVQVVVCGGHGEVLFGGLAEEIGEAGRYLDQDHEAWEAAGEDVPNPLEQVFREIQAHYTALAQPHPDDHRGSE